MFKRIFIVGFMGSGKTSLGKKLAQLINYNFIDIDKEVERQNNKSISLIFKNEGEAFFRAQERRVLLECFEKDQIIISTGGGLPCNLDNMHLMNSNGYTIYLHASVKILAQRLHCSQQKRPLLSNISAQSLETSIELMLKQRELYYSQAKLTVNTLNLSAKTLYKKLLETEDSPLFQKKCNF